MWDSGKGQGWLGSKTACVIPGLATCVCSWASSGNHQLTVLYLTFPTGKMGLNSTYLMELF